MTGVGLPEFNRYEPPAGAFIKTPQLGNTREWIEPFMTQIAPYLATATNGVEVSRASSTPRD